MIYAVIDTNVLVSAQISKQPHSETVKVVSSMFNGHIKPVYNDEILAEYTEVLHRPKFHLSDDDISFMLDYIRHYGIHSNLFMKRAFRSSKKFQIPFLGRP